MASITISASFFSRPQPQAQAQARPRTQKPSPKRNPNPKFKPKKLNNKFKSLSLSSPPPSSSSSLGAQATTYTRLPPKEDFNFEFEVPSSDESDEIKLSDSDVAKFAFHNDSSEAEAEMLDTDDDDNEQQEEENESLGFQDETFGGKIVDFYNGDGSSDFEEEGEEEVYYYDSDGKLVNLPEDEFDDLGLEVKEKGVPAVMRCFDRAKIYVKAGDGGNGVVAFRREKYVPLGGPSGGDGGRGGNVYLEVDGAMNSLLPFRNCVHYRAGRGAHGQGRMMCGRKGEDVVVKVAPGTVVREAGNDEVLLELLYPGQRALLLPGGRGGRGNASFKSGNNKVPKIAENGEEGPEMWLELELKLVADVGIVGAPNAGKSTLLSVISAAQPEIANYPFTTLLPNLGVVSFDYDSTMVVADLPGLLEGAHRGFGLGHEFLRHTERCSALVHVVDGSGQQPEFEFDAVRLELEMFSPELAEKPFIVAYNKMDLPEAYESWPSFKEKLEGLGIETFCMSAVKREGTHEVISAAYKLLQETKEPNEGFEGFEDPKDLNHVADMVQKQRSSSISEFEITRDGSCSTWYVNGAGLQRFVQMTNWRYIDSNKRFQHVLEACGVNRSLMKLGVKEGDTVIIGEMEMVWHDSAENSGTPNLKKRSTESIKWPHLK
ncbi:hypothetical protein Golob_004487 [Gossypium lobatum]|uniref:Obg domain-containing protein n=1 Tax=Gossypium lobatum TaxID=34289 RepID=A0A7J8N1W9_9ROSI|nr:hypothetical protein [Gossypium lobatum]